METAVDQLGREVRLVKRPQRIVSLVPSQSEFLYDLGLGERLIGVTKFCVHPRELKSKVTQLGGTKTVDLHKIRTLAPDLIVCNKEENTLDQVMALAAEFPVWISDVNTIEDGLGMMRSLSRICDEDQVGESLVNRVQRSLSRCKGIMTGVSALYFMWSKPLMLASRQTFIDAVMSHVGFRNLAPGARYPETDLNEVKGLSPHFCLLSSEPFPFTEKHASSMNQDTGGIRCVLVDGEMFSWYGSRLALLDGYMTELRDRLIS